MIQNTVNTVQQVIVPPQMSNLDQFLAYMNDPNRKNEILRLTLETLQYVFDNRRKNRPIDDNHVNKLVELNRVGRFHSEMNALCFDRQNKLADGQHRISAGIKSGELIILVRKNVSEEELEDMDDVRKNKSINDRVSMKYDNLPYLIGDYVRRLKSIKYGQNKFNIGPTEAYEFYNRNKEIVDFIEINFVGKKATNLTAVKCAIMQTVNNTNNQPAILEKAKSFVLQYNEGGQNNSTNPAIVLNNSVRDDSTLRKTPMELFYKTLRALEIYCNNETCSHLRAPKKANMRDYVKQRMNNV